jgi:hypothetical protein
MRTNYFVLAYPLFVFKKAKKLEFSSSVSTQSRLAWPNQFMHNQVRFYSFARSMHSRILIGTNRICAGQGLPATLNPRRKK